MARKIVLKVPARIHVDVMNIQELNIGKVGGGGIGVAIDTDSFISLEIIDSNEDLVEEPRKILINHYLDFMRNILKKSVYFKISCNFDSRMEVHNGMGTNALIQSAIVYGVNYLLGSIMSKEDLISIMQENYYEEKNGEIISEVFCSGVAHNVIMFGGLCFIDDKGQLIHSQRIPPNMKLGLIRTSFDNIFNIEGKDEDEVIVSLRKKNASNAYFKQKNFIIRNRVIPDLQNNEYFSFFESMNEFSKMDDSNILVQMCNIGGIKYNELEKELSHIPNLMMRISSNSPYVCIITDKMEEVEKVCKQHQLGIMIYAINNEGIKIIKEE